MLMAILLVGCGESPTAAESSAPVFFVGQDLDAIRGYVDSGCCPSADGYTGYLSFYNLRSEADGFGGLGLDLDGRPIALEHSWGAGPVSAYKTATEFGAGHLAIGLSIAENEHPGGLDALVAGDYDANIDQLAKLFPYVDGTVYLRIGYEFDGRWNQGYEDGGRFVRAWRRIVDRLREHDVQNVAFVWQAAASVMDELLDERHEDIRWWYPGDDYVDWLGFSWFMHPDATAALDTAYRSPTPRQLAAEVLNLARATGKPVLVAEAAPQGFDLGNLARRNIGPLWDGASGKNLQAVGEDDIWAAWYGPLFDYLNENADVIKGLAYINCLWDEQPMWGPPYASGYWGDTRMQVQPAIAKRFSDALAAWRLRLEHP